MSPLKIFWQENALYMASYAAFSLLCCLILSAVEHALQTSALPYTRLLAKSVLLSLAASAGFCVWLYIIGWQSRLLGAELVTGLVMLVLWGAALYFLGQALDRQIGLTLTRPRLLDILPLALLIAPCLAGYLLIMALGSAWKN